MTAKKLENFFYNEMTSDLRKVLFTRDNAGKYYLFNKYIISPEKNYYKVSWLGEKQILIFSHLKTATAWCVLHNVEKYGAAARLLNLELRLFSIDTDIAVHKNKIRTAKTDFVALISMTKLQEDIYKRRIILKELSGCINNSKNIQYSNFGTKDSKIKTIR
jgi:hypothetical protein